MKYVARWVMAAGMAVLSGVYSTGAEVADVEIDRSAGRVKSLISGRPVGEIAVAGRLYIELHANFMAARTEDTEHVLNWYNLGYSGGDGKAGDQGGTFGNFGLDVPWQERATHYPRWSPAGDIPAVQFNGQNFIKADFAAEADITGDQSFTVEVWARNEGPGAREVILGWQSEDGSARSAPLPWLPNLAGSPDWRHIAVVADGDTEAWYVDGERVRAMGRRSRIAEGHRLVLGGASERAPSFTGHIAAVRVHRGALSAGGIARNAQGGVMLGTTLVANIDPNVRPDEGYHYDTWSDADPDDYFEATSTHFRYRIPKSRIAAFNENQARDHERVPRMLELSEACYHAYSEIHALRMPLVSAKAQYRGDGVKYLIHIAPTDGASWMGWHGDRGFGYPMQGPGHMNPHELVHGVQAQTGGGMQGNYWEVHANFPQTWVGVWQSGTAWVETRDQALFEATGRSYYDASLMMRHLAHTPQYGVMFIAKMWYSGGDDAYPWITFDRFNPDPETTLGYEWARMVQRNVTWDYVMHPPVMPDEPSREDHFRSQIKNNLEQIVRHGRIMLYEIPYLPGWWRPAKNHAPQQTGWNLIPLHWEGSQVTVDLLGYANPERGGDWHYGFVAVDAAGASRYGDIRSTAGPVSMDMQPGDQELYLAVAAIPTKVVPINMVGDLRSPAMEQFPYRVKLEGATPRNMALEYYEETFADRQGAPHANGGGFVEVTATVADTAYVGPNAWVVGNSTVSGNARIEDHAVIDNGHVRDHAIVSDYGLVNQNSTVKDFARVRDYGWVSRGSTLAGHAKLAEHAILESGNTTEGRVTLKGMAIQYGGVARGTAIMDGNFAKGNELIAGGRWMSWSWGAGQNPGETGEDFGGLYLTYTFENPHPSLARDDHGLTWAYLHGDPVINTEEHALVLDGRTQFVELQPDVSDHSELVVSLTVNWAGGAAGQRLFDFSNGAGNGFYLTPQNENGKLALVMDMNGAQHRIEAPAALPAREWVEVTVAIGENGAQLLVDGQHTGASDRMSTRPFLEGAGGFFNYLGASRAFDHFFHGLIGEVTIKNQKAPDAPQVITFPETSATGRYTVDWSEVNGTETYYLERSADGGDTWTRLYIGPGTSYEEDVMAMQQESWVSVNFAHEPSSTPELEPREVAGIWPQANWNNVSATNPSADAGTLLNNEGARAEGISLKGSGGAASWNTGKPTPDTAMLSDFMQVGGAGPHLTISGVDGVYDLVLYICPFGDHDILVDVNGETRMVKNRSTAHSNPNLVENDTYALFTGLFGSAVVSLTQGDVRGLSGVQIHQPGFERAGEGTYLYRVRGINSAGVSPWRTGDSGCVVSVP